MALILTLTPYQDESGARRAEQARREHGALEAARLEVEAARLGEAVDVSTLQREPLTLTLTLTLTITLTLTRWA